MPSKNVGKKIVTKKCENTFFIFTLIREQKMGVGGKARNNFSRKIRIMSAKKVGKKSSKKSAKTRFYIHTNIVTKKWGEKKRETIFPETHE